jgi:hypothetical protein
MKCTHIRADGYIVTFLIILLGLGTIGIIRSTEDETTAKTTTIIVAGEEE